MHMHMRIPNLDPVVPDALRMRRFYVRSAFRRAGIGRDIAHALLERAFRASRVVTVNATPGSLRFWDSIGFCLRFGMGIRMCIIWRYQ